MDMLLPFLLGPCVKVELLSQQVILTEELPNCFQKVAAAFPVHPRLSTSALAFVRRDLPLAVLMGLNAVFICTSRMTGDFHLFLMCLLVIIFGDKPIQIFCLGASTVA